MFCFSLGRPYQIFWTLFLELVIELFGARYFARISARGVIVEGNVFGFAVSGLTGASNTEKTILGALLLCSVFSLLYLTCSKERGHRKRHGRFCVDSGGSAQEHKMFVSDADDPRYRWSATTAHGSPDES